MNARHFGVSLSFTLHEIAQLCLLLFLFSVYPLSGQLFQSDNELLSF